MLPFLMLGVGTFALKTANGAVETLYPANDRKATVVFVVLAECPNARAFSPEIARVAKDYAKRGVRFVMAFADGEPAAMRTQMKEFGLAFPAAKAEPRLVALLGAKAVPTAAIVGADGKIAYVGRIDDRFPALGVRRKPQRADLRIALDQFLAKRPVSPTRTTVVGCLLSNG